MANRVLCCMTVRAKPAVSAVQLLWSSQSYRCYACLTCCASPLCVYRAMLALFAAYPPVILYGLKADDWCSCSPCAPCSGCARRA
eukprot:1158800-Pelagomonas_calceolata.AAC.12